MNPLALKSKRLYTRRNSIFYFHKEFFARNFTFGIIEMVKS
ncbi:hypothetical protein EV06_0060 [Prochlorococcus sp. MIT 0602]|nr:hypothetical protein EV07_1498 [Prochlorococcus sp. MIT 0603]KGG17937.1 hypothetical protein EV06_0060 [Prochlorococcus sp. MIT 0602]